MVQRVLKQIHMLKCGSIFYGLNVPMQSSIFSSSNLFLIGTLWPRLQSFHLLNNTLNYMANHLLPFELTGNTKSQTLVILLHGFPDSIRLWDDLLRNLPQSEASYLCISYPNFHPAEPKLFGQGLQTIVDRIHTTIQYVDDGRKRKKIVVAHDWGACFAYMLDERYPKFIHKIMSLDVGGRTDEFSIGLKLVMAGYQLIFALFFLISIIPFIGNPIATFLLSFLLRLGDKDCVPVTYNASQNYPYLYLWINRFSAMVRRRPDQAYLVRYEPSVPVIYIYGKNKPFQFHSQTWFKILEKNSESEVHAVAGGHWIMKDNLASVVEILKRIITK